VFACFSAEASTKTATLTGPAVNLRFVSSSETLVAKPVYMVTIPAVSGVMGVLGDHAPTIGQEHMDKWHGTANMQLKTIKRDGLFRHFEVLNAKPAACHSSSLTVILFRSLCSAQLKPGVVSVHGTDVSDIIAKSVLK
jgi:hypothetical protein